MTPPVRTTATPCTTTVDIDGIDAFAAAASKAFVPLRVTSGRPEGFQARLSRSAAGAVAITEVRAGSHVVERTEQLVGAGGRPQAKISLLLEGTCLLVQDGREALLRPGDLGIYDTSRPYTMVFDDDVHVLVLMLPHTALGTPVSAVQQVVATRFSGCSGAGALVVPFLTGLAQELDVLSPALRARMGDHAVDLVATLVSSELDARCAVTDAGRPLVRQAQQWIDAHLGDEGLGPVAVAAALHISVRHLHALFQDEGSSVAGWIRSRRLDRCRRGLLDPVNADRSVATIAARWGFHDAAHFSHAFKSEFGISPSRARAAG